MAASPMPPISKPVALVSMPTLSARFPSFQLALLKPTLEAAQIRAQAFSLFMYFGTHVGWKISEAISEVWPCMLGEWIWTKAAFGNSASEIQQQDERYFREYSADLDAICRRAQCSIQDLVRIRDEAAPSFVDFCVRKIDWTRFGLVGFSIVFQQLLASLALARGLKQSYPDLPIILGGASMEDDIADEVMKRCPQIDFAHCGDGEQSFPDFIQRLYGGHPLTGLKGIMWRDGPSIQYAGRAPNFADMNATPVPDFDEYFYARREGGYEWSTEACEVMLPVEAARGCWWGEKNHCTFCGLNRSGMEFRAKDSHRFLEQLDTLSSRYGVFQFNAIDNIMAPSYTEVFGHLAAARSDIKLHFEIRPSLSRTQLGRMRRGGLQSVQPGVESFSTRVLKTMRKQTTGMRNLELVKWCTYYGINNLYNILVGFPGEAAEDFTLQNEVIEKIPHFQPPYAIATARADRGSPMFTEPAKQGIVRLTPASCYRFIFPKQFDLARIAYYFEHEMEDTQGSTERVELFRRVAEWQERWRKNARPFLRYRKGISGISIEDGRGTQTVMRRYDDDWAALYEFCADARTIVELRAFCRPGDWIGRALSDFLESDLMVQLDGRYLSLALPIYPYFDSVTFADQQSTLPQPVKGSELFSIT